MFGCERLSDFLSDTLSLPVPGAVVGLLLLLCGLMLYGRVPRGLARISTQLLYLLPLLLLPAAVGVFFLRDLTISDWFALCTAIVFGTLISLTLSALLLRKLLHQSTGADRRD
ncbi:CidA/LrgA family protein [Microbulbifer sp. 2205BS26-8]|uniref:CidA/LrgA family protein n=1 Tax=Microbulbifer sp. 2205BS26-8 TaxID=3064386 RepID=UPI00273D9B75|nr:CidA/LrgA family protein [Microbulbifer sp. 2205BS26-8]MDP5210135.1 CidA/LrgA family protein [Microbulbifer sp. 2205BS26-8]